MKKILYIFGFCCLLALGFTACQQEEDALAQLSLEELQKRDSKKHPKLEYVTTGTNNHDRLSKSDVTESNGKLQITFRLNTDDKVSISISDKLGKTVFKKSGIKLINETDIIISSTDDYPYSFKIEAKEFLIIGSISLE